MSHQYNMFTACNIILIIFGSLTKCTTNFLCLWCYCSGLHKNELFICWGTDRLYLPVQLCHVFLVLQWVTLLHCSLCIIQVSSICLCLHVFLYTYTDCTDYPLPQQTVVVQTGLHITCCLRFNLCTCIAIGAMKIHTDCGLASQVSWVWLQQFILYQPRPTL